MKNDSYKFWVYVISDGKSTGLLVKRQISSDAAQECKYFHFAGGLSPTYEILNVCNGDYVQLKGGVDEKRFVNGLMNYIGQVFASVSTKKAHVIESSILDGQDYQTVINHFFEPGRIESPLRSFFVNPNVFKQNILSKVRNKDNEYIGMAEEFGVLSPHNLTVEGFKYLRPIKEILKVGEDIPAQWFRKTGPVAADFDAKVVYCREKLLKDLKSCVLTNSFSMLVGIAATGKTVLVRQLAYELSTKDRLSVYFFDCDRFRDFDYNELTKEINRAKGVVILENIHLETQKFQHVYEDTRKRQDRWVLLISRPSFHESQYSRAENLEHLTTIMLEPLDDVDEFINYFIAMHPEFTLRNKFIKKVCGGNLWLLAYALEGCIAAGCKGQPESWIAKGVHDDLEDLGRLNLKFPEVVVALSPLYCNEVLTSERYLINTMGFSLDVLNALAKLGEITYQESCNGDVLYGLPHSALANAYWEGGIKYRNRKRLFQYEDFVFDYTTNFPPNGIEAIIKTSPEVRKRLLTKLDLSKNTIEALESEQSLESINSWLSSDAGIETIVSNRCLKVLATKIDIADMPTYAAKCILEVSRKDRQAVRKLWALIDLQKFVRSINKEEFVFASSSIAMIYQVSQEMGEELWSRLNLIELADALTRVEYYFTDSLAISNLRELNGDGMRDLCKLVDLKKLAERILEVSDISWIEIFINELRLANDEVVKDLFEVLDLEKFAKKLISETNDWFFLGGILWGIYYINEKAGQKLSDCLAVKEFADRLDVSGRGDIVSNIVYVICLINADAGRKLCKMLNMQILAEHMNESFYEGGGTICRGISAVCAVNKEAAEKLLKYINYEKIAQFILSQKESDTVSMLLALIHRVDKQATSKLLDYIYVTDLWWKVSFVEISKSKKVRRRIRQARRNEDL